MACRIVIGALLASLSPCVHSRRINAAAHLQPLQSILRPASGSCVPLKNAFSFSTVAISVGSPAQIFEVVADTGSDSLIIESCRCVDTGNCLLGSNCFRADDSKTFVHQDKYLQMTITFGSGPVVAFAATDQVNLGHISATIPNSLLLMTSSSLDNNLQLEGILGLGVPPTEEEVARWAPHKNMFGFMVPGEPIVGQGVLEWAGVPRFSMCMNAGGEDGVLRMGKQIPMERPLQVVGRYHWGAGLRGVTVGTQELSAKMTFCSEDSMRPGQQTPCSAMVDSGTTLILAPIDQLAELFVGLCDTWQRCREHPVVRALNAGAARAEKIFKTSEIGEFSDVTKTRILLDEIATCNLTGLPPMQFHISGADGTKQTLDLAPHFYIMSTIQEKTIVMRKWLKGLIPIDYKVPDPRGGVQEVCLPAFSATDMATDAYGPMWIFGTPFFYRYTIGHDRASRPPSLSFDSTPCDQCGKPPSQTQRGASLRRIDTDKVRFPKFNASLGL